MPIKVLNKSAFADGAYGLNGDIGGIPRKTYWTPDGREMKAIPSIREYVKKDKDGKVIETGTRDANLDNGWLLSKPQTLKLYCPHCNKWHDTKTQITQCGQTQRKFITLQEAKARKEEQDKTTSMEKKIKDLEAMVNKLMEDKK